MRALDWNPARPLPTGGEVRACGPETASTLVLLVGGGTGAPGPGTWSSSMTWLAPRIARAAGGDVRIAQVRYRDTSFGAIRGSMADVGAAIELERGGPQPPRRIVLVGLSMGGGTCLANVGAPGVVGLVAIAPWFPEQVPLAPLAGKRLLVVHGSLDNALPLVPGTSLVRSRAAVEEARALGADAEWRGVSGGLHGLAVRVGEQRLVALPRAGAFARIVVPEVVRLARADGPGGRAGLRRSSSAR